IFGAPLDVYNNPASPFVYGFLGNVNLFHGRVHEGVLQSEGLSFAAPDYAQTQDTKGIGYVRPHDLEVERYAQDADGIDGIVVKLLRVHAIGPLAQLELERDDNNALIEAVISNDRFTQMQLKEGETLVVRPKKLQVFIDDSV